MLSYAYQLLTCPLFVLFTSSFSEAFAGIDECVDYKSSHSKKENTVRQLMDKTRSASVKRTS